MIRYNPEQNTLAYLPIVLMTKKRSFITFPLGVNVIKLFFFVADDKAK